MKKHAFYEYRDKSGIGHTEIFDTAEEAVKAARDYWYSLCKSDKDTYRKDSAPQFLAGLYEMAFDGEEWYPEEIEEVIYTPLKSKREFIEEALSGNGVMNDSQEVWVVVDGYQYTIDIDDVLDEERTPFEASNALEKDLESEAWDDLYDKFLSDDGIRIG